jgi:flavin reductase (DIM6/NTAB) family NADH-FMN oxidoreductase RutF
MRKKINPRDVKENAIKMIAEEWMLISAGDEGGFNMMTASWGFMGEMWGADSVVAAVRPQRYTMEFIEKSDLFTLSFYGDRKDIHAVCGRQSGRDVDKAALTGLTPVFTDGTVTFEQARLTLVCKKRYCGQLRPECFTLGECSELYPADDRHYMIIGEIVAAYEQ